MKKILIILSLATCYLIGVSKVEGSLVGNAAAVQPTTPQKTTTPPSDVINELKERIASRVAQLKLVERRGIIGTVTDISDTQITITDVQKNTRFVDVDELTKFSSPKAKEAFGISDITKGNTVSILGLYNKQSRRILARFVNVVSTPIFLTGTVISVNEDEFSAKIISDDQTITTVDVEKITKTVSYTKEEGQSKSGFSKIQPGQHIAVIGFPDAKEKNRMIASRFIIFSNLPKNPNITISNDLLSSEDEVIPSTKSGVPIAR